MATILLGEVSSPQANPATGQYTRVFRVSTDGTGYADSYNASKVAGIPQKNDSYPLDTRSKVSSVSASLIDEENDTVFYLVTVTYAIPTDTGSQLPDDTSPIGIKSFSYSVSFQNQTLAKNYENNSEGEDIKNSAGDLLKLEGASKALLQITENENVSSFNPSSLTAKINTVSGGSLDGNTYPENSLLFLGFNASSATANGISYTKVSRTWLYSPDKHTVELRDRGINELKDGALVHIEGANRVKITEPVDLDGTGKAQKILDGDGNVKGFTSSSPEYITVRIYPEG